MDKDILKIIKVFEEKPKASKVGKNYNNNIPFSFSLNNYINDDYIDAYKNNYNWNNSIFINSLYSYLEKKIPLFKGGLFPYVDEEGYYLNIGFRNEYPLLSSGSIFISGLLKYYYINTNNPSKKEILTIDFLKEKGYKLLTKEFGNTELDNVILFEHMPYKARESIKREQYKDFIERGRYYNDKMDEGLIEKDRKKDFRERVDDEYQGKAKIRHLLFGEDFIGDEYL